MFSVIGGHASTAKILEHAGADIERKDEGGEREQIVLSLFAKSLVGCYPKLQMKITSKSNLIFLLQMLFYHGA